jgi:hypothetical protein
MYTAQEYDTLDEFLSLLANIREISVDDLKSCEIIRKSIYTTQQAIGATLDGLSAGESNIARKINGDLFERFIQLLIRAVGVTCKSGTVQVPVYLAGEFQFNMSYQHDLLLYKEAELKIIGSVKTSSKDRLGKMILKYKRKQTPISKEKITFSECLLLAVYIYDPNTTSGYSNNRKLWRDAPNYIQSHYFSFSPGW